MKGKRKEGKKDQRKGYKKCNIIWGRGKSMNFSQQKMKIIPCPMKDSAEFISRCFLNKNNFY